MVSSAARSGGPPKHTPSRIAARAALSERHCIFPPSRLNGGFLRVCNLTRVSCKETPGPELRDRALHLAGGRQSDVLPAERADHLPTKSRLLGIVCDVLGK